MSQQDNPKSTGPWWREKFMWLVVGGPSLVVVASFVTLALALHFPDPVLEERVPEASGVAANAKLPTALAPAQKARNHAATGSH